MSYSHKVRVLIRAQKDIQYTTIEGPPSIHQAGKRGPNSNSSEVSSCTQGGYMSNPELRPDHVAVSQIPVLQPLGLTLADGKAERVFMVGHWHMWYRHTNAIGT